MGDKFFYDFLLEYKDFFLKMVDSENHKLNSLISNNLIQIQKNIALKQAEIMKIKNLEKNREYLQKKHGYDNMTFKQIIENCSLDYKQKFETIFTDIDKSIGEIKFLQKKSSEILNLNLNAFGEDDLTMDSVLYTKDKKMVNKTN
ncbi:MAG: hypothetical protein ACRCZK_00245, partial [Oscillospiraceae bacterium]